jgi:hypothetical protein
MSARWDDAMDPYRYQHLLMDAMTVLSLDVTRAVVTDLDLAIDKAELVVAQPELRRVLAPPFQARLADPSLRFEAERLLGSLNPETQRLVGAFYDRVLRYARVEKALFCWDIVLMRYAKDDVLWGTLNLPPESSEALRKAFRASNEWGDIQKRLDAAFERPLSTWDRQVAVLGLLPPEDEGVFGIGDQDLRTAAEVVRKQGFWRMMAEPLGHDALRSMRARCQAFLETQKDIAPWFGRLHDPWLLAHPELTLPDTPASADA